MLVDILIAQDVNSPTRKVWGAVVGNGLTFVFYGPGTRPGGSVYQSDKKSYQALYQVFQSKLRKGYSLVYQGCFEVQVGTCDPHDYFRGLAKALYKQFWINRGQTSGVLQYIKSLESSEPEPEEAPKAKTLGQLCEEIDWESVFPPPDWAF